MVTWVAFSGEVGVVRHLRDTVCGQATEALLRWLKRVFVLGRALVSILTLTRKGKDKIEVKWAKVVRSKEFSDDPPLVQDVDKSQGSPTCQRR